MRRLSEYNNPYINSSNCSCNIHSILSAAVDVGIVIFTMQTLDYMNLNPEQHCAVAELVRGRDTFVSLLTGYGMSLVYQVLPACTREILLHTLGEVDDDIFRPVVFILSPLLSLMQDQAEHLLDINMSSTFLLSGVVKG